MKCLIEIICFNKLTFKLIKCTNFNYVHIGQQGVEGTVYNSEIPLDEMKLVSNGTTVSVSMAKYFL